MANQLKMAMVNAILTLKQRGWSMRRIARELGIDRSTVKRYVEQEPDSKPATQAPIGSDGDPNATTGAPAGSEHSIAAGTTEISKQVTEAPTGSDPPDGEPSSSASKCEPYRAVIENKVRKDLTAQRIYQDLVNEHDYIHSYYSVRRFVNRLRGDNKPLPFRRMECAPGEEAQVDFGTAAPVIGSDGKRRRPYVLRISLSHSRKAYSEAIYRQTTDNFISTLENSFIYFGGTCRTLIVDNLRAAVSKADWYDPDINPKVQSFCQHYGIVILPTKPYTPRHKGKIENQIGYVQKNALKGKCFSSIEEQNAYLLRWETNVADKRIHGTTRKQVSKVFEEAEKPALLPLPTGRFPSFAEAKRSVHRDGHIEVSKAYYSVPPEYVSRIVWARWDGHLVRIYNSRMEQLAIHVQGSPGTFHTLSEHIHTRKISSVEKGAAWLLQRAEMIGPSASAWSKAMLKARGIQGIRVLIGLMSLTAKHSTESIEHACSTALTHEAYKLQTIRELIKKGGGQDQKQFEFIDEHPIIRNMSDYGDIVKSALH